MNPFSQEAAATENLNLVFLKISPGFVLIGFEQLGPDYTLNVSIKIRKQTGYETNKNSKKITMLLSFMLS